MQQGQFKAIFNGRGYGLVTSQRAEGKVTVTAPICKMFLQIIPERQRKVLRNHRDLKHLFSEV